MMMVISRMVDVKAWPTALNGAKCLLLATIFLLFVGVTVAGPTIYVSPGGDDNAPGTAEKPIRTLSRLENLLERSAEITEVVFDAGIYYGSFSLSAPEGADPQKLPRLVIRAREGAQGKVIIDGARHLTAEDGARPLKGAPGVYVVTSPTKFRTQSEAEEGRYPRMWDVKGRKRYLLAADERAVRKVPGTFSFTDDALYVHTFDGKPPSEHAFEISMISVGKYGFSISRPNVTVRGLWFRNFFRDAINSSGICVYGQNGIVEECYATNCPRGFKISGPDVTIRRCRAEDCGCGAHVKYVRATVQDCVFTRVRDDFMVPMPLQEDTAIEVYYDSGETAVLRRNICQGFNHGIYVKCEPGEFYIENNTLINNGDGIGWSTPGGKVVFCRRNLVYGSSKAFGFDGADHLTRQLLTIEDNCVWPSPWMKPDVLKANLDYVNTRGKGNFLADPRIVAPEGKEFRLLPDSPCLPGRMTMTGVGALGSAPEDFRDTYPPLLKVSDQPSLFCVQDVGGAAPLFYTYQPKAKIRILAFDNINQVMNMKVRIGDKPWTGVVPFASEYTLKLPKDGQPLSFSVSVADEKGNWSEPATIRLQRRESRPRVIGEPVVRTNAYGATIAFRTNYECFASGEYGLDRNYGWPLTTSGVASASEGYLRESSATREHVLALVLAKPEPGKIYHYRVVLKSEEERTCPGPEGTLKLMGDPRVWYVSPEGTDAETDGSQFNPWRTLQYAADRALPGDQIILLPGVYTGSTLITHGGAEGAPLVIKAREKWQTVFDGQRRVRYLLALVQSPYVEISGLELRWYGVEVRGRAIYIDGSPRVTVRGCKIWNAFWHRTRPQGTGIYVTHSPGFVAERNLIFKNDGIMLIRFSPHSRIVYNTGTGHSHFGINFEESVAGTVFRNNDLACNGNDVYGVLIVDPKEMETFDADYNNLGSRVRYWRDEPGARPNCRYGGSKAIVIFRRKGGTWIGSGYIDRKWVPDATTPPEKRGKGYFRLRTFEDWQKFSGKDQHSVYADANHHHMFRLEFELDPDSPNIGAGENGSAIGAMGVYKKAAP